MTNTVKENSQDKLYQSICLFTSCAVFLFSALCLLVPSGYTYGPLMLAIGGLFFVGKYKTFNFQRDDWFFIFIFIFYFIVHSVINIFHHLPVRSFDLPFRFLLAIPAYLILIMYPPQKTFFVWGIAVGAFGAGVFALMQNDFSDKVIWWRAQGYINPIQFGDISILLAGLLFCAGLVNNGFKNSRVLSLIFLISALMGVVASLLSWSRGGWLAIPGIAIIVFTVTERSRKKKFLIAFSIAFFLSVVALIFLPDSDFLKKRILLTKVEITSYLIGDDKVTSINTRAEMWKGGIEAFFDRPILGWGDLDMIRSNYPARWRALAAYDGFNHLHNEYIDVLAKRGIIGFCALTALYLIPLFYFIGLIRLKRSELIPFAACGVTLIFCVMIFGLTQCFLAHNSGVMVFVFYLVIIKAYCRNIIVTTD